jgi:hypothetical protein
MTKEMEDLNKKIEETNTLSLAYEEAIDKLWSHPILWPLNTKIIKWEDVEIPNYLIKAMEEEIASIPNMWDVKSIEKADIPAPSFQSRLEKTAKQLY